MRTLTRRGAMQSTLLLGILGVFTFPRAVYAGSYLRRSAVLLKGAEMEGKALRARFRDKELARLTHQLALARVKAAHEMLVPDEVKRAHPHLLLVMESYERAAEGALRGSQDKLLVALARAREEGNIFIAVLKQAGWVLPRV